MSQHVDKDSDIVRIRYSITSLNNLFKQGSFSILIKLIVSFLVTLEINNGADKITIQEILEIIKDKISELNRIFDELCFTINKMEDQVKQEQDNTFLKSTIEIEKKKFRVKVYKLFDLREIFHTFINKCTSFSYGFHKLLRTLDESIDRMTVMLVDSILYTDTTDEFETTIYNYISERVSTIVDPAEKKLVQINIIQNVLDKVINDKTNKTFKSESIVSIELAEKK